MNRRRESLKKTLSLLPTAVAIRLAFPGLDEVEVRVSTLAPHIAEYDIDDLQRSQYYRMPTI